MSRSLLFFFTLLFIFLLSVSAHSGHDDGDGDGDDDSSSKPNLRSKKLILVKIWCLILIFIGTFVGGISPYFLKWNEGFLVLGTQFAGGVFLGTALMHFLSDSNETFEDLTTVEYPFAFMLATAGYLLTMAADCAIYYVYGKKRNGGSCSISDVELQGLRFGLFLNQVGSQDIRHTTHFVEDTTIAASSLGDNILLIAALCFHSVFEGIAIGVADNGADAWKALWTISLHKIFAAIAMGIALLRMIPDRPLLSCVAYAFAFAISSPIGVAIGIIIDATTQGVAADWIFAISMGVACGVFVYVSVNHLLAKGYVAKEKCSLDTPLYKFLAVLMGVGVIAIVMIWDT
ncbi:zinc transporter 11-like isoform X2 [Impatiens glandulifera]|uniref:zinc transporter 11-like isoform X2 n=1 Tax=Impatiens glandulifera TaxID=253017 RepID=UPI001FB13EA9|nr:zinc transporter 11-like isoform X2 [Impatiens glandulifera]